MLITPALSAGNITDAQSPGRAVYHLDDLYVGQRFASGSHVLDAAQIKRFTVEFDLHRFRLDDKRLGHRAVTTGLLMQGGLPIAAGIICCGSKLSSLKPTRPSYTLRVAMRETPL